MSRRRADDMKQRYGRIINITSAGGGSLWYRWR
jgi:hypothetical protein